jgi:hypothetical protein
LLNSLINQSTLVVVTSGIVALGISILFASLNLSKYSALNFTSSAAVSSFLKSKNATLVFSGTFLPVIAFNITHLISSVTGFSLATQINSFNLLAQSTTSHIKYLAATLSKSLSVH